MIHFQGHTAWKISKTCLLANSSLFLHFEKFCGRDFGSKEIFHWGFQTFAFHGHQIQEGWKIVNFLKLYEEVMRNATCWLDRHMWWNCPPRPTVQEGSKLNWTQREKIYFVTVCSCEKITHTQRMGLNNAQNGSGIAHIPKNNLRHTFLVKYKMVLDENFIQGMLCPSFGNKNAENSLSKASGKI